MTKTLTCMCVLGVLLHLGALRSHALTLDLSGAGWAKPEVTVVIRYSEDLTQEHALDIREAIDDWNDVLMGIDDAPILRVAEDATRADVVITVKTGDRNPLGQTLTRTAGQLRCVLMGAFIQLNGEVFGQEISGAGMRSVARHELGHALGLRHSDDPEDLMYPLFDYHDLLEDYDVHISDYDRDGIAAIYPLNKRCAVPDFLFWEE